MLPNINVRTQLWIIMFFGFGVNYMLRLNINIAIVEMVYPNPKAENLVNSTKVTEKIHYDWNTKQQSNILGASFFLHWASQVPGGILSHRFGTKCVIFQSMATLTLVTLLTPLCANWGYYFIVVNRILVGFITGVFFPAMNNMVSKWVPPKERGTFMSSFLGSSFLGGVTYIMCGYIMQYFSWQAVFYVTGGIGATWCLIWQFFVYNSPAKHPKISAKEQLYIESSLGDIVSKKKLSVPWKEIFMSRPVWINATAQWGANTALLTLMTTSPTYLKRMVALDIHNTGIWTGLPHIARWIFSVFFGWVITYYHTSCRQSVLRKVGVILCTIIPSLMMYGLAFTTNSSIIIVLIWVATTATGTIPAGLNANTIDLSPNFSAVIQGLCGTVSQLPGFIFPLLLGYLTGDNNENFKQWHKFYFITATTTFACGILFTFFSSSDVQTWNFEKNSTSEETERLKLEKA